MNRLLLLAALIIAAPAFADDEKKVPVKRIDASSPALQAVENAAVDVENVADSRAQDYNSSRSNNESSRAATSAGDYNSSRSNNDGIAAPAGGGDLDSDHDSDGDSVKEVVCGNGVDQDCDGPVDTARIAPANHNTTRSNRTSE